MLWCSQVASGNGNNLRLRVYGEAAGLEWVQESPDILTYAPLGEPPRLIRRGGPGADAVAKAATRVPAGHPEGYLEAFAQLYADLAEQVTAHIVGRDPNPLALQVPTARDGVRGVRFIEAAIRSSKRGARWTEV